ncbi:uncharacterized protein METZ01_LOCUS304771, partial [marine metagenome]
SATRPSAKRMQRKKPSEKEPGPWQPSAQKNGPPKKRGNA